MAEALNVSSKTLQTRFSAALHRSVAGEIRRIRIEKANRELTHGERSTEEIALRAGFTSNSRMCEVFQRELGVSPRQYRKQRMLESQALKHSPS